MATFTVSSLVFADSKPFRIGPGLAIEDPPIRGVVELTPDDELGGLFSRVEMTIDLVDDVLHPTAVSVTAADGIAVTGAALRQLPVRAMANELIARAVNQVEFNGDLDGAWGMTSFGHLTITDEDVQRIRQQGPVDESLAFVANLYELGRVMGLNPVKFVEDNMGMPRTTITQWVRRARDNGILRTRERHDGVDS